jgi:hypothetical protein
MKLLMHSMIIYLAGYLSLALGCQGLSAIDIEKDSQALAYCKQNKNSYVVVVWPKGYTDLTYIIKKLNQYALVKYSKKFTCNKEDMFLLFRKLHREMSYKKAKKFFKPYMKAVHAPYHLAALVLNTDAPIEQIVRWKYEIRDHIGAGFYSMHINDHYYPETIEAAQAVFQN